MTTRAVLDVNILASAFVSRGSPPGYVLSLGLLGKFQIVVSDHILMALARTWTKPYFVARLSESQKQRNFEQLTKFSIPAQPDRSVRGVCDDEEDDLVLGTAVAANADYLVTGDKGFQQVGEYQGVRIVGASEFLYLIRRELESDT